MIVSLSSYAEEETIVFVGKQLAYESKTFEEQQKLICPEPEGDEVCVTMDSLFAAQYKIEDLVKGKLKNKVIDIYQFDHYGIPEYFKYKYALIVADVTEWAFLGTNIQVFLSIRAEVVNSIIVLNQRIIYLRRIRKKSRF